MGWIFLWLVIRNCFLFNYCLNFDFKVIGLTGMMNHLNHKNHGKITVQTIWHRRGGFETRPYTRPGKLWYIGIAGAGLKPAPTAACVWRCICNL